ncbi:MAG: stage III sporulation protein AF [Oscillospiraceae bacterium]
MEVIKNIGINICITLVITAIFTMLVPNNKLDKILKFSISLFFLASLISPFFNSKLDFHINIDDIITSSPQKNISQKADEQFYQIATKNLEMSIEKLLNQKGIPIKKIKIFINNSDNNSIFINKVIVTLDKANEKYISQIKEIIEKEVGAKKIEYKLL